MDLQGARAIVTGGASGIGAACVAQLREAGARVVSLDLADAPHADWSVRADVGDEDAVIAAVGEAVARLDGLDVAVLSAGVGGSAALLDLTTFARFVSDRGRSDHQSPGSSISPNSRSNSGT